MSIIFKCCNMYKLEIQFMSHDYFVQYCTQNIISLMFTHILHLVKLIGVIFIKFIFTHEDKIDYIGS